MSTQTTRQSYSPSTPAGADHAVCAALQAAVVLMVDLQLQAKQAHWNVVGRSFRSLHTHLDEIVELARDAADTFAEGMRTNGTYLAPCRLGRVHLHAARRTESALHRTGRPRGQHAAAPGCGSP